MSVTLKTTRFLCYLCWPSLLLYLCSLLLTFCTFSMFLQYIRTKIFCCRFLSKGFLSFFFKYCEDNIFDFANLLNTTPESSKDRVTLKNPFLLLFSKGYSYQIQIAGSLRNVVYNLRQNISISKIRHFPVLTRLSFIQREKGLGAHKPLLQLHLTFSAEIFL